MKKYEPLKKTLRDYHVDIDKDKLWQQTSHAIPQKKKRRVALIPIFIGAILFSGGSLVYKSFTTSHEILISDNTLDPLQKAAPGEYHVIKNQNKDHSITDTKKTNDATAHTRINTYPTTEQAMSKAETRPIDISPAMTVQTGPDEDRIDIKDGTAAERNRDPADGRVLLTSFGPALAIDALPISRVTEDAKENPLVQKRKPVIPHTPFRHIFFIGFLGSVGVSELTFSAKGNEAKQMRAFLESNTRSLEAISATITGHVQLSKGFAAGAGLRYNRLTHEINYLSTISERTTTEGTTTIIIDENGQQHLVSGSLGSTHIRELNLFRYTTHQSLDLEMTLYKTLMDIRRTKINGYVKAGMNVAYGVSGSAFTGEQVPERFGENDNPFERSSTLTYGAGVHLQYRIHPRWVLLAAAGFDQMNIRHRDYQKLQWQNKSYSVSLGMGCVL